MNKSSLIDCHLGSLSLVLSCNSKMEHFNIDRNAVPHIGSDKTFFTMFDFSTKIVRVFLRKQLYLQCFIWDVLHDRTVVVATSKRLFKIRLKFRILAQ